MSGAGGNFQLILNSEKWYLYIQLYIFQTNDEGGQTCKREFLKQYAVSNLICDGLKDKHAASKGSLRFSAKKKKTTRSL